MKDFRIVPKEYVRIADRIIVWTIILELGKSVCVSQTIAGQGDIVAKAGSIVLEGADYDAWGNDDTYIAQKIAEVEGLTLA